MYARWTRRKVCQLPPSRFNWPFSRQQESPPQEYFNGAGLHRWLSLVCRSEHSRRQLPEISISLSDAVRLVRSRAEQMEQMYPVGYGLSAIVGLSETQVAKLVDVVSTEEHPVFVGNINSRRQIVIAGSNEGMERFSIKRASRGARKAERLDVPVPSHCSLLQPVADSLTIQLQSISVKDPKPIYLANVSARAVRSAQGVARDLADNIAHGVRWHDATTVACELGCELLLEVPPGHVLT